MNRFKFRQPLTVEALLQNLGSDSKAVRLIAGGTDLIVEIKSGVENPVELVSLGGVRSLSGVANTDESVEIGAMTRIADLAAHATISSDYPVLAQAVASIATPQIRNVGTLGGNLCQRPRCWYYRHPQYDCRKKGGAICYAINGRSKYHAILGARDCFIVHPSDAAVALVSYRARVTLVNPNGSRSLPLDRFYVGPDENIEAETVLEPDEVLAVVEVPKVPKEKRGTFVKIRERASQDFALVSVALTADLVNDYLKNPRLVLGGVAPVPYRAKQAERALSDVPVDKINPESIGVLAVQGAKPLRDNYFKVEMTKAVVKRAVDALLRSSDSEIQ